MNKKFEIIRELGAEFGEGAQLFSEGGRDEYVDDCSDVNPDWDWDSYPDSEVVSFDEVVSWISEMNEQGKKFIFRNSEITEDEINAFKKAL